ncbi:uncharacterized protein I206_107370 [Kwoniella pini CBS 10737]|uniref:protein-ribulosamine 3-kinase n=1 Tax=Kwoniella pini CBS 10737 TaxID=1296096 RepID=A0A1B9HX36_9TREE|nr:uncharacterized protein I206_05695 [Kwoniella pini CBS 10737]OCF47835.1 hypothetical protein I206_05695 [Kwoniella pini CBS 10737]
MPSMHPLISEIFSESSISLTDLQDCSNGIYLHKSTGQKYFTKVQFDIEQMKGEIEGLKEMYKTAGNTGLIPKVLGFKINQDKKESVMVTQYFELNSSSSSKEEFQKELGFKLSKMHNLPPEKEEKGKDKDKSNYNNNEKDKFGFYVNTHCGITKQNNEFTENWEEFFRDKRLGDLINRIEDSTINKEWEIMKEKTIPILLRSFNPPPKPVVLHGDLWSGNKGFDLISKSVVIFDPACYFGHNEADLGITHMFGGFTKDFYDSYHSIHPKSKPYYEERQKLYELYHHLNHTLMFGGGYKSGTLSIMRNLNDWAKDKEIP